MLWFIVSICGFDFVNRMGSKSACIICFKGRDIYLKSTKKIIIFFVVGTLILVPFGASAFAQDRWQDEDVSAEKMTVDVLVARPLGLIATALGIAVFVISFLFSAAG